ncbi:MAG: Kdo hydroxylase family protein [Nitrospirales bacterium]
MAIRTHRDAMEGLVEMDRQIDIASGSVQAEAIDVVESGRILLLRDVGFELTARERALILDKAVILPGQKEKDSRTGRPTLIFDPECGKFERTKIQGEARREIEAMMQRFTAWADGIISTLFPSYRPVLERERATYRPCARSTPQGMHIDTSYKYPSQGRGMLRLFCNINPSGQPRVWQIGEPFEPFVSHFLPSTSRFSAWRDWLLNRLLAARVRRTRTAYDRLVADIRRLAKGDDQYQTTAPRQLVEFPVGSSWIALTDLAVHGAISGQHSLDQTFFLPVSAMREPARSSLRILERLTGRTLV